MNTDYLGLSDCEEQSGRITFSRILDVGIGTFSALYEREYTIRRCHIPCDDCSDGWETTVKSGGNYGTQGEWTVRLLGIPIDVGFNWSLGEFTTEIYSSCTGLHVTKGCYHFAVSLYGQTGFKFRHYFKLQVGINATIQNEGCVGDADKWSSDGYIYVTECWWWACYTKNLLHLW